MTDKKESESTEVVTTSENGSESSINVKELVAQLSGMEEGVKLTGSYFNPELGDEIRCWFIGNTEMNAIEGDGKVVAVRLLLEDETTAITASTMIVSACRGLSIPTAIMIVKTDERKLEKGKVLNVFEVTKLESKS